MSSPETIGALDEALARLTSASWKDRDAIKAEILEIVRASGDPAAGQERLRAAREGLDLELRWELDEIIEALEPEPEPEPEPEETEEQADRPLSAADLQLVYDDPRGLALHKHKTEDRWFATQRDPRTNQPQTFELMPQEVQQLKTQLQGSPYWVIGSGAL